MIEGVPATRSIREANAGIQRERRPAADRKECRNSGGGADSALVAHGWGDGCAMLGSGGFWWRKLNSLSLKYLEYVLKHAAVVLLDHQILGGFLQCLEILEILFEFECE